MTHRWKVETRVTDKEPMNLVILYNAAGKKIEEFELPTEQTHALLDQLKEGMSPREVETVLVKLEEKVKKSAPNGGELEANKKYFAAMRDSVFGQDGYPGIKDGSLWARNIEKAIATGELSQAQLTQLIPSLIWRYEAYCRKYDEEAATPPEHLLKYADDKD